MPVAQLAVDLHGHLDFVLDEISLVVNRPGLMRQPPGGRARETARRAASQSSSVRCGAKGFSNCNSVRKPETGRSVAAVNSFVQTIICEMAVLNPSASMSAVTFLIVAWTTSLLRGSGRDVPDGAAQAASGLPDLPP